MNSRSMNRCRSIDLTYLCHDLIRRFFPAITVLAAIGGVLLAPASATGQALSAGKSSKANTAKAWTPPRTPDGHPDLQGIWSISTLTPLERPKELAGKSFFTPEEAAAFEKRTIQQVNTDRRGNDPSSDLDGAYNESCKDRGDKVLASGQTSLIVDPPDGRIPPMTAAAQKRVEEVVTWRRLHPADGPESFNWWTRCITRGLPLRPTGYNNNYQIVQTPGYVVLYHEMINEARVIPLDGRPHIPSSIRSYLGDGRGHWEGDTLVVDTTNFVDDYNSTGSGPGWFIGGLHLIERFTRVDAKTINYEFTIDDPATFAKSWTARFPMTTIPGPIFEYACHEGNYAMTGSLSGARAEEKRAGKQPGKTVSK